MLLWPPVTGSEHIVVEVASGQNASGQTSVLGILAMVQQSNRVTGEFMLGVIVC